MGLLDQIVANQRRATDVPWFQQLQKAANPPATGNAGSVAGRVQELMGMGLDYNQSIEIAMAEQDERVAQLQYGQDSTFHGFAPDYSRDVAGINAQSDWNIANLNAGLTLAQQQAQSAAERDVAAMQVDAARYQADMDYRAAVDVAAMQVDASRYQADASYRQAVDTAQIQARTDMTLGLGQLGLGYFQTLAEMQKAPADWIGYWYATQGQQLPEGYKGAGIPEGLQLPSWLQGLYEQADYTPSTVGNPLAGITIPEAKLLGPPTYAPTPLPSAAMPSVSDQADIARWNAMSDLQRRYVSPEYANARDMETYQAGTAGKTSEEMTKINRFLAGLGGA